MNWKTLLQYLSFHTPLCNEKFRLSGQARQLSLEETCKEIHAASGSFYLLDTLRYLFPSPWGPRWPFSVSSGIPSFLPKSHFFLFKETGIKGQKVVQNSSPCYCGLSPSLFIWSQVGFYISCSRECCGRGSLPALRWSFCAWTGFCQVKQRVLLWTPFMLVFLLKVQIFSC